MSTENSEVPTSFWGRNSSQLLKMKHNSESVVGEELLLREMRVILVML